jgi:hypothetical protein
VDDVEAQAARLFMQFAAMTFRLVIARAPLVDADSQDCGRPSLAPTALAAAANKNNRSRIGSLSLPYIAQQQQQAAASSSHRPDPIKSCF